MSEEIKDQDPSEMIAELNALIEQLEHEPNAEAREKALSAIQLVVELYGEGLRQTMSVIESAPQKDQILSRLLEDELIRALLLIHGLMPVELYDRVAAALNNMRAFFLSQGCQIELLGIDDGHARLRLIRSGQQAPPISFLKTEIEKALIEAAPDLSGIEVEGLEEQIEATNRTAAALGRMIYSARKEPAQTLVQIKRNHGGQTAADGAWIPFIRAHGIEDGQFKIVEFKDVNLLICRIAGEFYAYRNRCAAEQRPLDDALYEIPMVTCSCHGYRYDLRRGNCMEHPELKLEQLPVKVEEERVKVAV